MSEAQDQQELMAHEEAIQLHKASLQGNSRGGMSSREQARILDTVIESELQATDAALSNLRAKDFPLSNYDDDTDTVEFKWMQEILDAFSKARYPHPQSGLQGLARAWATGDSGDRRRALELDEFAIDESYKMGTYSRAKRGEDMAQQETTGKMVSEARTISDNEGGSKGRGGILGRIPGL